MSSTSSRNTPGNYQIEQHTFTRYFGLVTADNGAQGRPTTVNLPGNGLLIGKMHSRDLAANYTDIETQLFGIGSTNLVQPQAYMPPQINTISSLNIASRIPTLIPDALVVEPHHRVNYRS
jgi:hypothetical protein